jgi:hypothetical protein
MYSIYSMNLYEYIHKRRREASEAVRNDISALVILVLQMSRYRRTSKAHMHCIYNYQCICPDGAGRGKCNKGISDTKVTVTSKGCFSILNLNYVKTSDISGD